MKACSQHFLHNLIYCLLLQVTLSLIVPVGKSQAQATRQAGDAVDYLRREGRSPIDYVLSKLQDHRIVIVGENHWLQHDVNLILELIPRLPTRGVTALGVEMFRVSDQEKIDEVVNSDRWDPAAAMSVMQTASWPYREYFEIIHAIWKVNHALPPEAQRLKLIALGPERDWRERLPLGQTYDTFMAQKVKDYLAQPTHRILIYCGFHHAFTRYYQPELPRAQRVERFINRMGNILWREFGEDTFMITLHRPWQCRAKAKWSRCLPLSGAIDCGASRIGHPVAFDVAPSPFAQLRVSPEFYYALGYPSLRLGDITDGYIWTIPIESYKAVDLIPLSEFAPDQASLKDVSENNPFSDKKGLGRTELESLAADEVARLRDFVKSSGWEHLRKWRQHCKKIKTKNTVSLLKTPSPL